MLLTAAVGLAHGVVRDVKNSDVLGSGWAEDFIEADGVTWEMTVFYWKDSDMLRITGESKFDPSSVDEEHRMMGPFMVLFQGPENAPGTFVMNCPASWLPPEIQTTMEGVK